MEQYSEHSNNNKPQNKDHSPIGWKPYALVLATAVAITFGGIKYIDYSGRRMLEQWTAEHKPEIEKIEAQMEILNHDAKIRDSIYKRTMQLIDDAALSSKYTTAGMQIPAEQQELQPQNIYSQALTLFTDAEQLQDPDNRRTFLKEALSNMIYCKTFVQPPSELEEKITTTLTRAEGLLRQE